MTLPNDDRSCFLDSVALSRTEPAGVVPGVSISTDESREVFAIEERDESVVVLNLISEFLAGSTTMPFTKGLEFVTSTVMSSSDVLSVELAMLGLAGFAGVVGFLLREGACFDVREVGVEEDVEGLEAAIAASEGQESVRCK
jgi:hypothetical protein